MSVPYGRVYVVYGIRPETMHNANLSLQQIYYPFENLTNAYTGANDVLKQEYPALQESSPDPDTKPAKVWLPEGLKCTALESDEQKAIQIPPEVELQGRVKSMLDTGWVFDPYKVSVSSAHGVQDPPYGLTQAEHKWFDDMSIGISKAKREKTGCEIGNVEDFSLKSPEPEENVFLNDFDLNQELDSFYGDTDGISGLQHSNEDFDEVYTDDEVDLLRNNEDTQSEIAAPSNKALQTQGAPYKMGVNVPSTRAFQFRGVTSNTGYKVELGAHDPDIFMHCQDKLANFKDSAVHVEDSSALGCSKESLLQSPTYVEETLAHSSDQANPKVHAVANQTIQTDQTVHHSNDAKATDLAMASSQDNIDSSVPDPNLSEEPLQSQSHVVGTSRTPIAASATLASATLSNTQTRGHNLTVSGVRSLQSMGFRMDRPTYVSPYPEIPQSLGRDGNALGSPSTQSTGVHTNQSTSVSSHLPNTQSLSHDGSGSGFPSTQSTDVHTNQTTLVSPHLHNTQALVHDGNASGSPGTQRTGVHAQQNTSLSSRLHNTQSLGRDGHASGSSATQSTGIQTNQMGGNGVPPLSQLNPATSAPTYRAGSDTSTESTPSSMSRALDSDGNEVGSPVAHEYPTPPSPPTQPEQSDLGQGPFQADYMTGTAAACPDVFLPDPELSPVDTDEPTKESIEEEAYFPPSDSPSPPTSPLGKRASVGSRSSPIVDRQERASRQHKSKRSVKSAFGSKELGEKAGEDGEEEEEEEEEEGASPAKKKARRSNE